MFSISVATGSVSDREFQIGLQEYLHREDHNADTGDPIADNYRGCREALHQFGKLKTSLSRYLYRFPFKKGKIVELYNICKKIPLS